MLIGMRLGLAFAYSDHDVDFILNTCTWNKGTYFNLQKMSSQRYFITNELIKICNDPINLLSKEKITKLKEFIDYNKEALKTCFWKKEVCKVINYMYKIVTESIKVMEFFWKFHPEMFDTKNTDKKSIKKTQQKKVAFNINMNTYNGKKSAIKRPSNMSLPKIVVNTVGTNKSQKNLKKFVMPKNPFKSIKENPKHLKNSIWSKDRSSVNCSTNPDSIFANERSFEESTDKVALDIFDKSTNQSKKKLGIQSLSELPSVSKSEQNSSKNISKSIDKSQIFRISNKRPSVRSSVDLGIGRRETSKNITLKVKLQK